MAHIPRPASHHPRPLPAEHIYPTFGDIAVTAITLAAFRTWHADLARAKGSKVKDRPTARAHAYGLLRTILNTAVADELIAANPCRMRRRVDQAGHSDQTCVSGRARGTRLCHAQAIPTHGPTRLMVRPAIR